MIFNDIMSAKGGSTWGGKKYWVIFKNRLQASFAYRINYLASFFAEGLSLVIMLYLWISIYHQGNKIGEYSLGSLIIYFIFTKYLNLTVRSYDVARYVGEMVRLGNFNNYLLKPLSFFGHTLSYHLGIVVNNLLIFTIIFYPILFWMDLNVTLLTFIYFIFSIILAFFINFLFFYSIGLSGLYFGYIAGFNFLMMGVNSFFSGSLIPIDLFPKYIININNFLPFKYIVYVPISIITNKFSQSEILINLLFALIWSIILWFIGYLIFKGGTKKYEAISG